MKTKPSKKIETKLEPKIETNSQISKAKHRFETDATKKRTESKIQDERKSQLTKKLENPKKKLVKKSRELFNNYLQSSGEEDEDDSEGISISSKSNSHSSVSPSESENDIESENENEDQNEKAKEIFDRYANMFHFYKMFSKDPTKFRAFMATGEDDDDEDDDDSDEYASASGSEVSQDYDPEVLAKINRLKARLASKKQ